MKTNKQRAELIIKKANELKINNFTEVPQPKKKVVWWKVITAISCSLVVLVGALVGLIVGLANNGYNIDKMYIANFNAYTAIGSGYINSNEQTASAFASSTTCAGGMNLAYAASNGNNGNYLMGQKSDGSFEKIAFSKTQNGRPEKQQQGYITKVMSFNRFTFVEWNQDIMHHTTGEYSFSNGNGNYSWDFKTFVIDNKTGKIFSLSKTNISAISFDLRFIYGAGRLDAEDCVYFFTEKYNYNSPISIYTYYKVSIENNELKIEEVVNNSTIDFDDRSIFSDKYGNLFLTESGYNESNYNIPIKYCISNGDVIDVNKRLFRSINGIVYTEDKTMKVNENGELVPNTFEDCDLILSRENIIKKDGNVEYYYGKFGQHLDNNHLIDNIYKVTWSTENSEEYSYEVISLEDHTSTFVTTSDKIYFLDEKEIFAVEIETGKKIKQDIGTDYIFNNIQTDNLGNVLFEGVTKNGMKNVNGIIDNNGNIDVSMSNRKYVVYYIKPLN